MRANRSSRRQHACDQDSLLYPFTLYSKAVCIHRSAATTAFPKSEQAATTCVRTCFVSAATCSCRSTPPVMQTVRKPLYFLRSRQMDATCGRSRGNDMLLEVFHRTHLPDDRLSYALLAA